MKSIQFSRTDCAIIAIILLAYLPLSYGIIFHNGGGQRLSSWMMFFILDIISLIVALKNKESYAMIIAYGIGGLVASICLVAVGATGWNTEDTLSMLCVIFSVITWVYLDLWKHDLYWATVSSTLAQVIAGIPLIIETWRHPDPTGPLFSFCIFFIGNLLTFIAAKEWTVPKRLLSGSLLVLNTIILLPLFMALIQKYLL